MLLRLLKRNKKLVIFCPNGTIASATDESLVKILTAFHKPHLFKGSEGVWNTLHADMDKPSGETYAYVDDTKKLIIIDGSVFANVIKLPGKYISVTEYAELHGKCRASIKNMCADGRIEGAYKTSSGWLIPHDSPYPKRKKRTVGEK